MYIYELIENKYLPIFIIGYLLDKIYIFPFILGFSLALFLLNREDEKKKNKNTSLCSSSSAPNLSSFNNTTVIEYSNDEISSDIVDNKKYL